MANENIIIAENKPEACLITWDYNDWCTKVTQGVYKDNWEIKVGQYIVWTWGKKKYFGQVKEKEEMLDVHGEPVRQWFIVSDSNGKCLVEKTDVNHTMYVSQNI